MFFIKFFCCEFSFRLCIILLLSRAGCLRIAHAHVRTRTLMRFVALLRMLHFSLNDTKDVQRATLEMCRKANCMLQTFSSCDPVVLTKLFNSHCLSLYDASLWTLKCSQVKALEICFNNYEKFGFYHEDVTQGYFTVLHNCRVS